MILASDGFFEKFSASHAVTEARRLLHRFNGNISETCEKMVTECLQLGSCDNVSLMIVVLHMGQSNFYSDKLGPVVSTSDRSSASLLDSQKFKKRPKISKAGLSSLRNALATH